MGRIALIALMIVASSCARDRRYPLEGQILAIDSTREEITVRHEDIKGFMPGMTMPFKVADKRVLAERKAGELIKATLVVSDSTGYLENVVRTGDAPLPLDLTAVRKPPIREGSSVEDAGFVDQAGRARRLSEWRGKTLAVTFVYTRCPVPDFCPLMDRNFSAVQQRLFEDASLGERVRLLSVSFDPDFDSPGILRQHAERIGARDDTWVWLTGDSESIDRFAGQFGVSIIRPDRPMQEITHNLRTAVIDREGRLVKIFTGNDWKPEELLATLRATDGR